MDKTNANLNDSPKSSLIDGGGGGESNILPNDEGTKKKEEENSSNIKQEQQQQPSEINVEPQMIIKKDASSKRTRTSSNLSSDKTFEHILMKRESSVKNDNQSLIEKEKQRTTAKMEPILIQGTTSEETASQKKIVNRAETSQVGL